MVGKFYKGVVIDFDQQYVSGILLNEHKVDIENIKLELSAKDTENECKDACIKSNQILQTPEAKPCLGFDVEKIVLVFKVINSAVNFSNTLAKLTKNKNHFSGQKISQFLENLTENVIVYAKQSSCCVIFNFWFLQETS